MVATTFFCEVFPVSSAHCAIRIPDFSPCALLFLPGKDCPYSEILSAVLLPPAAGRSPVSMQYDSEAEFQTGDYPPAFLPKSALFRHFPSPVAKKNLPLFLLPLPPPDLQWQFLSFPPVPAMSAPYFVSFSFVL